VRGQISAGANLTAGSENGIMQFVHDLEISAGGVIEVTGVDALGAFATTRPALQTPQGVDGDLGVANLNGYATSFTQGLTAAADLYRVTLRVAGPGNAEVAILPAADAKFAASTPEGVKVGHTDTNGNPAGSIYPPAVAVTGGIAGDADGDGDVDVEDFLGFPPCMTGPTGTVQAGCGVYDFDADNDVDLTDYSAFQGVAQ